MSKQSEIELAGAQYRAGLGECVTKLESNRHYKQLILQAYFIDYAAQQVSALADPQTTPEIKQQILGELEAISRFKNWLIVRKSMGNQAQRDVASITQYLRDIEEGVAVDVEDEDNEE